MDPSTSSVQDPQNQPASDQSVVRAQQPPVTTAQSNPQTQQDSSVQKQQDHRTQISVGGVEEGAAIVQEDADNEDEELLVAPQETKNNAVIGQNEGGDEDETTVIAGSQSVADIQENISLQPSGPETAINASPEVEKVLEKSPDLEKPDIPKVVSDAGVTQSGPGVIQVDDNNLGVTQMPAITAQQAATQFKTTHLHDSKHWFVGVLMYIWRKLQADQKTETAMVNETEKEEEGIPQT